MEHFQPIDDSRFLGRYKISKEGEVLLVSTGIITKGRVDKDGYRVITAKSGKVRSTLFVHRLVAKTFIPNPENKPCVNHRDGNKSNNHVDNLEWCTYSENMKHAVLNGLSINASQKGENHNTAKRTFEMIQKIREEYKLGNISMRDLAKKYNCSSGYISDVVNYRIRQEI